MSKFGVYTTKFCDRECLLGALQAMDPRWVAGLEVHAHAVHLRGYQNDVRKETAEIVIPRHFIGSASNDIGFKLQPDGNYTAIISEFDRNVYNETWMKRLCMEYGKQGVEKLAQKHKWDLEVTTKADGGLLYVGSPKKSRFG